jgi:hypothetical protein
MAIAFRSNSQIAYRIPSAGAFTAALAVREAGLAGAPKPRLLDRVRETIRARHYSHRTEKAYVHYKRMWAKQGFKVDFDPATDTIVFSMGGTEQRLKLNRANPNVPIEMTGLSAISAYHAGTSQPSDEEEQRLRLELEEKLESYYQSAHRVLKLFVRVPDLAKIGCIAISRVRNELIEHTDEGALYSFGVGSSGPRVKPMHRDTPKFNDEGLVPNTRALVDAVVVGCTGGAP